MLAAREITEADNARSIGAVATVVMAMTVLLIVAGDTPTLIMSVKDMAACVR